MLSPEKDLSICRLLVGWDALEKRLGGNPVIDFNLPGFTDPDADTRYASRLAVLNDLKELQQDSEVAADKRVAQKLRAQEAYLRNVMGEHWEFTRYIKATQGFTPRMFSEDEIAAQRERIENVLAPWDIRVDVDLEKCFGEIQKEIQENILAEYYDDVYRRATDILVPIIGPIPRFGFKVETTKVDAYWRNWVDGSRKEYRIRFNTHNVPHFANAVMTSFALHEVVAHMVQAAIVVDQIDRGELAQCIGLTIVHGPEQFQMEGLAISLPYFLSTKDFIDPLVVGFNEIYIHEKMVENNNAHIMINAGASIESCIDYLAKHLPYKTGDRLAHTLSSKVNNPQFRSYEHVYGAGAIFFRDIAEKADEQQKQAFLKRIYRDWLPFDELVTFRNQLLSSQSSFGTASHKYVIPQP